MKILHTSDWHLGRSLYGRKRYDEFTAFLDWLLATLENQQIDALLIAGDIFDTNTPSNRAQEIYYDFLFRVATSCCRHVVVIAGNHDSPSFLNAPKALLRVLNVYVVGAITDNLEDEVIVLKRDHQPEAIVCAVPYLRDKDIRSLEAGESIDEKNAKQIAGLKNHYAAVCDIAVQKRTEFSEAGFSETPIIAMGHLFTSGGKTVDGDGVRELYVGSLAHMSADVFPKAIDYLALGHLHVPQRVGNTKHIRYCGSPIPMGFGEAAQQKLLLLIEFVGGQPKMEEITIPCFQTLEPIQGSLETIVDRIEILRASGSSAWLEIEYTGKDIIPNLREILDNAIADSRMEILRIKNQRAIEQAISTTTTDETLDDLSVEDVFTRCLDAAEVSDNDRQELTTAYQEIIQSIHEADLNAE